MKLNYICDSCDNEQSNQTMTSFSCECGGQMRLVTGNALRPIETNYDLRILQ